MYYYYIIIVIKPAGAPIIRRAFRFQFSFSNQLHRCLLIYEYINNYYYIGCMDILYYCMTVT